MTGQKCGFAAIVGPPNVGKSTLLNRIARRKVSIVTHKVQTTRAPARTVITTDDAQIVFVDTPGLFDPSGRLERVMVQTARSAARDADCLIFLVNARAWVSGRDEAVRTQKQLFERLAVHARQTLVVINKIDKVHKPQLLSAAARISQMHDGRIMMISALTGDGVDDVIAQCARLMPEGVHLHPDRDDHAFCDLAFLASELVREAAMLRLHQELPYRLTVETVSCIERNSEIHIACQIIIADERHKPMIIGRNGSVLRQIGQRARTGLSRNFGKPVHLVIEVITQRNWQEDHVRYRNMNLDFDPA